MFADAVVLPYVAFSVTASTVWLTRLDGAVYSSEVLLNELFEPQLPEGVQMNVHVREPPLQPLRFAVKACVWPVCKVKVDGVMLTEQACAFGRNINTTAAIKSFFIDFSFAKTGFGGGNRVAGREQRERGPKCRRV